MKGSCDSNVIFKEILLGGGHAIEMPRPHRPKFHNLIYGCKGNSLLRLIIMLELIELSQTWLGFPGVHRVRFSD